MRLLVCVTLLLAAAATALPLDKAAQAKSETTNAKLGAEEDKRIHLEANLVEAEDDDDLVPEEEVVLDTDLVPPTVAIKSDVTLKPVDDLAAPVAMEAPVGKLVAPEEQEEDESEEEEEEEDSFPSRDGFVTGHRIPLELFSGETRSRLESDDRYVDATLFRSAKEPSGPSPSSVVAVPPTAILPPAQPAIAQPSVVLSPPAIPGLLNSERDDVYLASIDKFFPDQ